MNTPKSAIPRNISSKSHSIAALIRDLRKRECKKCHYTVDSEGVCSNLDCPNWQDIGSRIPMHHGRRWGRITFDAERYCLVFDANPTLRGSGKDRYIAFIGSYEADLERLRTSAAVLDFICQIRASVWGVNNGVRDFVNAIDELLHPQSSLCSGGASKTILNPREFLEARIIAASQGGAA